MKQKRFFVFILSFLFLFSFQNSHIIKASNKKHSWKYILQPTYDRADFFSEGLCAVAKFDGEKYLWGYIDKTGKEIIPLKYLEASSFINGEASVKTDKGWILIDKNMNKKINFISASQFSFSEDLAAVRDPVSNKYGFINRQSKVVIPYKYDYAENFYKGLAIIQNFEHKDYDHLIDGIKVHVIEESEYSDDLDFFNEDFTFINKNDEIIFSIRATAAFGFEEEYATSYNMGKGLASLYNESGKILASFSDYYFEEITYENFIDSVNNGFIPGVDIDNPEVIASKYDDYKYTKYKYGFFDINGENVIPCIYDFVFPFKDGIALVYLNDKSFYIDTKGNVVLEEKDDYSFYSNFSDEKAVIAKKIYAKDNPNFNEYRRVYLPENGDNYNLLFGYADRDGNVIIEPKFELAKDFQNGFGIIGNFIKLTIVEPNVGESSSQFEKLGFIDSKGNKVTPKIFSRIDYLEDNIYLVSTAKKVVTKNFEDTYGNIYDKEDIEVKYGLIEVK